MKKDGMQKLLISAAALAVFVADLRAAESGTSTDTAARTGTYKRPLLDVDGKRSELKASDTADASVAGMLTQFSEGDTGACIVKGTRGTIKGNDGGRDEKMHLDMCDCCRVGPVCGDDRNRPDTQRQHSGPD